MSEKIKGEDKMENLSISGNATIVYKVDKELLEDFENVLSKYNVDLTGKDNAENNLSGILKEYSSIKSFKIDSQQELQSKFESIKTDDSTKKYLKYPKLNVIHIAKLFKEKDDYTQFYISFGFDIKNESSIDSNTLYNYARDWIKQYSYFQELNRDAKYYFSERFKNKVSGKYIRSIQKDEQDKKDVYIRDENFKEILIKQSLGLNGRIKLDNCLGFEDDDHEQFINAKSNSVLEYAFEGKIRDFSRVPHFILAIGYKNYYEEKSLEISQKALELDASKYNELLSFAEKIAKFEAIYYTKNPTTEGYYTGFYNKFNIKDLHDEFIESLNGLIKYIGILHDKQEAQRLKDEQLEREKQREQEVKRIAQEKEEREEQRRVEQEQRAQEKEEREEQRRKEERRRKEEQRKEEDKENKLNKVYMIVATLFTALGGIGAWGTIEEHPFGTIVIALSSLFILFLVHKFYINKEDEKTAEAPKEV